MNCEVCDGNDKDSPPVITAYSDAVPPFGPWVSLHDWERSKKYWMQQAAIAAMTKQDFRGWLTAILQQNKAIRRKNKIIRRERARIAELEAALAGEKTEKAMVHRLSQSGVPGWEEEK